MDQALDGGWGDANMEVDAHRLRWIVLAHLQLRPVFQAKQPVGLGCIRKDVADRGHDGCAWRERAGRPIGRYVLGGLPRGIERQQEQVPTQLSPHRGLDQDTCAHGRKVSRSVTWSHAPAQLGFGHATTNLGAAASTSPAAGHARR